MLFQPLCVKPCIRDISSDNRYRYHMYRFTNLKFATFLLTLIAIAGYFIYPMMSVLLIVWITAFAIAGIKGMHKNLNRKEYIYYMVVIILYPIFEAVIKYMLINDIIPYSWNWLNRIEHFIAAIAIETLFYPFLKPTLAKLNKSESFLFMVFTTSFIGVVNEFMEYGIRIHYHFTDSLKFSYYYWDTIYDLAINVFGAITGFFVIRRLK
jgi:hypothetical protein